jgi:hypothetical protein
MHTHSNLKIRFKKNKNGPKKKVGSPLITLCVGFEDVGNKSPMALGSRLRRRSAISLNVHRVMAQSGLSANLGYFDPRWTSCAAFGCPDGKMKRRIPDDQISIAES